MSIRGRSIRATLIGLSLFVGACAEEDGRCYDDAACADGSRCAFPEDRRPGQPGTCEPCDSEETPYDGQDNDCDPSTRDFDLDQDGDNYAGATRFPGTDCDDEDPDVYPGHIEVCDDGKDNNCDGQVDEASCEDEEAPIVQFIAPEWASGVSGALEVVVEATDDRAVATVELFAALSVDLALGEATMPDANSQYRFSLATETLSDGPITLVAIATDVAGRTATSELLVYVDNFTAPTPTLVRPLDGRSYAGRMTFDASFTDASPIARVEVRVDGGDWIALDGPSYSYPFDTDAWAEGDHELSLRASDSLGNEDTTDVQFRVDRTPPDLAFVSPEAAATVSGAVGVEVRASDDAGIYAIESAGSSTSGATLSLTWDSTGVPNGIYTLTATATDTTIIDDVDPSGHASVAEVSVTIENESTDPTLSFVDLEAGDGVFGEMLLVVSAVEGAGGAIEAVNLFVDDVQVGTDDAAPFEFAYDFGEEAGVRTIRATATDLSGRQGDASMEVTVIEGPKFRLAERVEVGNSLGSSGYAIGDVDGDGVVDLVSGGAGLTVHTGTLAVQLVENGTVSSSVDLWSTADAEVIHSDATLDVVLVDLDGDSRLDAVSLGAASVRVHLNGVDGFSNADEVEVSGGGLSSMAVADLDNDGDLDVVVGRNTEGGDISVLLQAGGMFSLDAAYGQVGTVSDVKAVDVNDDGLVDVVLGRDGSALITTYLNQGDARFGAGRDSFTLNAAPTKIEVVDLDGNGRPDVLAMMPDNATEDGGHGLMVLWATDGAPGDFTPGDSFETLADPQGMTVADVTGDGELDVVLAAGGAHGVEILEGDGAGRFSRASLYLMARGVERVRTHDVNGDGMTDLLVSGSTDDVIAHARGLGEGAYLASPFQVFAWEPSALGAGNVYGDDGTDLIIAHGDGGPGLEIFEYDGLGWAPVASHVLPTTLTPVTALAVGDLDGLGLLDVAVGSSARPSQGGEGTAAVLLNQGAGAFAQTAYDLETPEDVEIGDVDNDGRGEVVFSILPSLANNGAGFDGSMVVQVDGDESVEILEGEGASSVAIGNLDGDVDGYTDFAVANEDTNDITVNLWNGVGYTTTTFNVLAGIADIQVGLVGNDDYLDIVGVGDSGMVVIEGDPALGFRSPISVDAGQGPFKLVGGDFNGDGLFDAVVLNSSDQMSVLLARPQGGFFAPLAMDVGRDPVDLVRADFDGDGRLDLALVHGGSKSMTVILNDRDRR